MYMTAQGRQDDQELINKMTDSQGNIVDEDLFSKLSDRYLPIVKSFNGEIYLPWMEFDDWKQEADIVMTDVIRTYDIERQVNFGAYYKGCVRNRFYDVVRKANAQKRIPNNCLTSYSANQSYYDDMISDTKATHPEQFVINNEDLIKLMTHCSKFEQRVLIDIGIKHKSESDVAKDNNCSINKVKNAYARCKFKYKRMLDNGLD